MFCSRSVVRCFLFGVSVACATSALATPPVVLGYEDPELVQKARGVALGESLVIEGLWLERDAAPTALVLERYDVWAPEAVIEVDQARRSPPDSRYFRGGERNFLDSTVLLTVSEGGEVDGLVLRGDHAWALGKGRGQGTLASRRADLAATQRPFECGLEELAPNRRGERATAPFAAAPEPSPLTAATHSGEPYHATLAIETDYEYYARFLTRPDPAAAAIDYLALVIGYGDVVYSREIDTSMGIGFARLWTAGAASDPWAATSNTLSALDEFQAYWNANQSHVERTAAHFFSGKALGGGIAYLGALCSNYASPGGSFDYGLSANIAGNFNWNGDAGTNPAAVVWDIFVVLHEIGHNFDAEHTHDFCGLGGSNAPVDRCAAGCAGSAQGLPSCSSPTPHFAGGAGTIMSYCHGLSGGMNNISLSFGEGHTCGVLPDRVSQWMSSYVASQAAARPACFGTGGDPLLTVTRTGSGTGTVTSSPAGISCGGTCSAPFASGTVVTLTAAATGGSTFTGWSGGGCSGTGTCVVTLDTSTSVFAEFSAPVACVDDAFEGLGSGGNDTCFGGELSVGSSQAHALCDEDWVFFGAVAGRTYRIETSSLTGGADTVLHLHDDCGPEIASNDDFNGLASRIEWTATANILADIRVRSFGNVYDAQKGYTIAVTCIANCGGGCPEHLTLSGLTSNVTETIKAAQTITAGDFDVLAPGDVTLHAGTLIRLGNGFSVASGARFTAIAGTTPNCP